MKKFFVWFENNKHKKGRNIAAFLSSSGSEISQSEPRCQRCSQAIEAWFVQEIHRLSY